LLFQSDLDDRNDPVVAVDDNDLITNDEVQVPSPLRMDLNERRGNFHHPQARWHRGADTDGEVDVINPRHVPACQDRLSDLGALLRRQVYAAARLALLRLALLRLALLSLPLLWSLARLSLALLRRLTLLTALALLRRLTGLALLTLLTLRSLARGLVPLLLFLATLLGLTRLCPLFSLTLRRLAGGLSFLPALQLALLLLLFLRALLRLALLPTR